MLILVDILFYSNISIGSNKNPINDPGREKPERKQYYSEEKGNGQHSDWYR